MENVHRVVRLVLASLALVELLVVVGRLRHRTARREAGWLALVLAALAARLASAPAATTEGIAQVAVLWSSGGLLLAIHRRRGAGAWSALCAVLLALVLAAVYPWPSVASAAATARAAGFVLLSIVPLGLLFLLWRKTGELVDLGLVLAAAAWGSAGAAELAGAGGWGLSDWLLAPLLALIGFALFEQGYLSPLTSRGYVDRLAAHRRLMRTTYARLLQREDALVVQDRLIAAGLLAVGASHEFRNVLARLRAAAEHGLRLREVEGKDASLRLVLEAAAAGHESAAAHLERIGREGREEPRELDLRALLERIGRATRPTWRSSGVTITVSCEERIAVKIRAREIEQVLINLVRNAVDALGQKGRAASRAVRLSARRSGGRAVIEVSDNAGGVPPAEVANLFHLGRSRSGSTGIGLYLARNLAERNGGSLSYRPIEGGSCFCLALPLASSS